MNFNTLLIFALMLICALIKFIFFDINLHNKVNRPVYYLIVCVTNVLIFSAFFFTGTDRLTFRQAFDIPIGVPIKTCILALSDFIIVVSIFKDKMSKKIFLLFMAWIITFLPDEITAVIYVKMTGIPIADIVTGSNEHTICNILCLVFQSILYTLMTVLYSKSRANVNKKSVAFLLPIFLIQFILLILSIYTNATSYSTLFILLITIISVSSIAVDIALIIHMNKVADMARQKEQLSSAIEIQKAENMYYQSVTEKNEEMSKIRHDYIDQLQSLYILVENADDDSKKKALKTIRSLSDIIHSTSPITYCENSAINSLLNVKIQQMKNENIQCNAKTNIPQKIKIDEIELSRLISNILNNAKDAAIKCSQPFVDILIKCDNDMLIINVKNSASTVEKSIGKKRFTTKYDKENHGYGMTIIKDITERYNGNMSYSQDGDVFCTSVLCQFN